MPPAMSAPPKIAPFLRNARRLILLRGSSLTICPFLLTPVRPANCFAPRRPIMQPQAANPSTRPLYQFLSVVQAEWRFARGRCRMQCPGFSKNAQVARMGGSTRSGACDSAPDMV